jgi:hypothetical protein
MTSAFISLNNLTVCFLPLNSSPLAIKLSAIVLERTLIITVENAISFLL